MNMPLFNVLCMSGVSRQLFGTLVHQTLSRHLSMHHVLLTSLRDFRRCSPMGLPFASCSAPKNLNICVCIRVHTTRLKPKSTPTCFIRRSFHGISTLVLGFSNYVDLINPPLRDAQGVHQIVEIWISNSIN